MMFWRRRKQTDFEDEIRAHLELEVERLLKLGAAPEDAELAARRNFGNVGVTQDRFYSAQPLSWLEDFVRDLRYAVRTLLRTPGFTLAVVLTLALGIGANSAMFTIVNAVIFRPLPYPESHRLVSISRTEDGKDIGLLDDRNFIALAQGGAPSLQSVAATRGLNTVVNTTDGPRQIYGGSVSSQYFAVIGIAPLFGRVFTDAEDHPGGPAVVVLSEQMWRGVFAGDSAILGKAVVVDTKPYTIIGVMPAGFTTPKRALFWRPLGLGPAQPDRTIYYSVVGRMRANATIAIVRAEISTSAQRVLGEMSEKHRAQRVYGAAVMTLHDRRFGDSRRALLLLFATVGILLLVACANLANLSLARAARREREFAVRLALGASRTRILRYVLCECLTLSVAGAVLGVLLAMVSVGYFVRVSPGSVANAEGVRVDSASLSFTLIVAAVTALLFGFVPALRAARGNVALVGTTRVAGSRREQFVRRTLIVAQLATALVMLTAAALVTKTLARVAAIDTGFEPEHLMAINPTLGRARYTRATAGVFYQELMSRLRRDPDVRAVALVDVPPMGGMSASFDQVDATGKRILVDVVGADPAYFPTIGARLIEGRWFDQGDGPGAPAVAIVTQSLARAQFPGRSALGGTFNADGQKTIVGVVADIRQRNLEEPAATVASFALAQEGTGLYETVILRTAPQSAGLAERVRKIVKEMDPALIPPTVTTMEERMSELVAPRRFTAVLLGIFAGLAAMLAIVGLYGVLSYLVAERTREIGIRVALGADPWMVLRFVLGSGMALTTLGVALGAGAAVFTVRLLRSMVYEMSVYDPWTFAASAGLLIVVALVASYIPARRAAAIDPLVALRME